MDNKTIRDPVAAHGQLATSHENGGVIADTYATAHSSQLGTVLRGGGCGVGRGEGSRRTDSFGAAIARGIPKPSSASVRVLYGVEFSRNIVNVDRFVVIVPGRLFGRMVDGAGQKFR